MKRSRSLVLTLMAGSTLGLAACDDSSPQQPRDLASSDLAGDERLYQSLEDCIAGQVFTAEHCQASFQEAQEAHAEVAPRFDNGAACEAEFGAGACTQQTTSNGTSWFMPFMAGYAVSSLMNNIGSGLNRQRYSKPLYYSPRGGYVTASGRTLSNTAAANWSAPSARTATTPTYKAPSPATTSTTMPSTTPRYGSTSQTRTTLTGKGGFSGGSAFRSFGG